MVEIRPATVADAPRCAEIYAPFVTDSWISFELEAPDDEEMAARISKAMRLHDWLVAEVDGVVIGYAYGSEHRSREAYQTSCDITAYIDSDQRRLGVGRRLYEALLPRLKARKMHAAFAGIALPNKASIALHQTMHFEHIGTYKEVGWKMGAWRDVAWFQRLL
ncbi:arsinothricin resistance N-acetyltransferase ArsN1 family B [Parasphingorhabdus sp.]|uniref:arsinothricin resistance N-acetyltransferase ArsN1 family B n=1 Tax=Parasphingorhabdus sp. TaxID=2709688 RepID=UPI003262F6F4